MDPRGAGQRGGGGSLRPPPSGTWALAGFPQPPGRLRADGGQLVRPPRGPDDPGGGHRHQWKNHHDLPFKNRVGGGAGGQGGPRRHQPKSHWLPVPSNPTHHAGCLHAPQPAGRDGGGRLHPCGDGSLFPRTGLGADGGTHLSGGDLHQPHPGPFGLPRHHGGLPPGQGQAVCPVPAWGA